MGNCCGTASHEDEGHQMKPTKSSGQTLGGNGSGSTEADKDLVLAAAENRRKMAENRGVQKEGGGKLSKQLAEKNKQTNHPTRDERDDKLVWD